MVETSLTALEIDVWTFQIDVPDHTAVALSALLSREERERADRFVRSQDALRYRAGRGRLRELLARYVGAAPQDLVLGTGPSGKPHVVAPSVHLHFNLTHSDGLAALAVSPEAEVGLDIERIRPLCEGELDGNFSRREQGALAQLSGDERLYAFYRCWTRKEAFVKAHGAGLSVPLQSFDVSLTAQEDRGLLVRLDHGIGSLDAWEVVNLDVAPGFCGALAVRSQGRDVRLRYRNRLAWSANMASMM